MPPPPGAPPHAAYLASAEQGLTQNRIVAILKVWCRERFANLCITGGTQGTGRARLLAMLHAQPKASAAPDGKQHCTLIPTSGALGRAGKPTQIRFQWRPGAGEDGGTWVSGDEGKRKRQQEEAYNRGLADGIEEGRKRERAERAREAGVASAARQ
jgi:hypothetical protein